MDQNKLRELNNQTNNVANEKWTPGAKNKTQDGPLDHTYPQGATQQRGGQSAEDGNTRQSGTGKMPMGGADGRSMQSQPSGGTGATQGITDSHQRQMEQRSEAYGKVEGQSLGNRQSGTTQSTHRMNPQDPRQPELQGGQPGSRTGTPSQHTGSMGVETGGGEQRDTGAVHESNDVTGGLPRSPGNSGPRPDTENRGTGPWNEAERLRAEAGVHESNDLRGGLPRSPGGANKLKADEKMDDDTGLSNRGL